METIFGEALKAEEELPMVNSIVEVLIVQALHVVRWRSRVGCSTFSTEFEYTQGIYPSTRLQGEKERSGERSDAVLAAMYLRSNSRQDATALPTKYSQRKRSTHFDSTSTGRICAKRRALTSLFSVRPDESKQRRLEYIGDRDRAAEKE